MSLSEKKGSGEKIEEFGSKMQKAGCALTLIITIPIILTIWIGVIGLIIGCLIAIVGIAAIFSNKDNIEEVSKKDDV